MFQYSVLKGRKAATHAPQDSGERSWTAGLCFLFVTLLVGLTASVQAQTGQGRSLERSPIRAGLSCPMRRYRSRTMRPRFS
jgi:hypothetical protein